jgi:hypothetical protein
LAARNHVEVLFAHTYLILFGKLAVGGLLALSVPPFFSMERGFYRSTAAVYLVLAGMMLAGEASLLIRYSARDVVTSTSVVAWLVFFLLFAAYVFTLFIELPRLRARFFPAAVAAGFAALAVNGWGYAPDGVSALAGFPYALTLAAGAAVSGAAVTGMLLGHWYLIETGLDLTPLNRMWRFCRASLRFELIVVPLVVLVMWLWPSSPWSEGFATAFSARFVWLVIGRVFAWALALLLLELIARTLAIPQTMAATGLFYIQALTIAVGEILGHWLLFRTGLPL